MIEPKYSKSEPAIFISVRVLRRQLLQQRLRLFQIARVETFGEPAVDRSEQFASLLRLPLVAPEACEPNGGGLANPLRELTEGSRRNVTALPSEPTKHVNGRRGHLISREIRTANLSDRGLRLVQPFCRDLAEVWSDEGRETMVKTAKTSPAVFFATCARLIPNDVRVTVQQQLPGNLSAEDWAMMREIVEAVRQC